MDPVHRDHQQQEVLEVSDRVARAAYIWIRHGNGLTVPASGSGAREDLVAGILCGLCRALELDKRHALLSAYIYSLIDGDISEALLTARSMCDGKRTGTLNQTAYQTGVRAANDLVALIEPPRANDGQPPLPI
jgi:hypothetical protein